MAKKKYQVKAPTEVSGMLWGMQFVNGVSREFDDKVLFDKLIRKGYKPFEEEKKSANKGEENKDGE